MPFVLTFTPQDVVVFRDHRPFRAGEHFLARSIFPLPSTFFGALRAALFDRLATPPQFRQPRFGFQEASWEHRLLGDAQTPGALRLRGPHLVRLAAGTPEPILPLPADLVLKEIDESKEATLTLLQPEPLEPSTRCLRWREGEGKLVPLESDLLPLTAHTGKPDKQRIRLTRAGAKAYAEASATGSTGLTLSPDHYVKEKELLETERRTGIARDPASLVVDESMLFTVETWRLAQGVAFAVEVDLLPQEAAAAPLAPHFERALRGLQGALCRLGGKGHLARIDVFPETTLLGDLLGDLPGELQGRGPGPRKAWALTPSLAAPAELLTKGQARMILGGEPRTIPLGGIHLRRRDQDTRPLVEALGPGALIFFDGPEGHDPMDIYERLESAGQTRGERAGHPQQAGYDHYLLLPYRSPTGSRS